jgi:hypothetical protein
MAGLMALLSWASPTQLLGFAEQPVLFVDGRTNLFVESVTTDLLGDRASSAIRASIARDEARALVEAAAARLQVDVGPGRFQLSSALFRMFGEGRMKLETVEGRRRGAGAALFASESAMRWANEGFACDTGTDSFAAGWLASSIEMALGRPANSVESRQSTACSRTGDTVYFDIGKGDDRPPRQRITQADLNRHARRGPAPAPTALQSHLREQMSDVGDSDTGVSTFLGVPVALRSVGYFVHLQAACRQAVIGSALEATVEQAFVEAWRLGTLSLLHRLDSSTTWRSLIQAQGGGLLQPTEVLDELLAAWGWGAVSIRSFDAGVTVSCDVPADEIYATALGTPMRSAMLAGVCQAVADANRLKRAGYDAWDDWYSSVPGFDVRFVESLSTDGDRCVVECSRAMDGLGRLRAG